MQIHRGNLKWAARMALILVSVATADGLVVFLVRKPFPWVAIIPVVLPLLVSLFVILPMIKAKKDSSAV